MGPWLSEKHIANKERARLERLAFSGLHGDGSYRSSILRAPKKEPFDWKKFFVNTGSFILGGFLVIGSSAALMIGAYCLESDAAAARSAQAARRTRCMTQCQQRGFQYWDSMESRYMENRDLCDCVQMDRSLKHEFMCTRDPDPLVCIYR